MQLWKDKILLFDHALKVTDYNWLAYRIITGVMPTKASAITSRLLKIIAAIEIKPDYAEAYYNRAVIILIRGDNLSGCRYARKACELGNCKLLEKTKGKGDCR